MVEFQNAVKSEIEPFIRCHDFTIVAESTDKATFASGAVVLNLTYAPYSGEVELWISRRGESQLRFSLADLLEAVAGPDHGEPIFFQAGSPNGLRVAIRAIKRLIELHGEGVLAGESGIFEAMAIAADRRRREYNNKIGNDPIRKAAEEAWKSRDYAKVKQLYESLRGEPTPVEAVRLEFATRHFIA